MTVLSGTLGAVLSSNQQQQDTSRQRRSAREANQANFWFQQVNRGAPMPGHIPGIGYLPPSIAGKTATFLPYYFNDYEKQLAAAAQRVFESTGTADEAATMDEYRRLIAPLEAAGQSAAGTVGDLYSGKMLDERLGEQAPVSEGRIQLANAKKNAGLEALQATLNNIKTIQGKRGFTGDSLANQRMRFDATRGIFTQGALDTASANLANASEVRGIQESNRTNRLSGLNLPVSTAQNLLTMREQPGEAVQTAFNRRLQPFQFFRLGSNPFQVNPLPTGGSVNPWQIAAAGAGATGRQALEAYLKYRNTPRTETGNIGAGPQYGGYDSGANEYGPYDSYGAGTYNYGGGGGYGGAAAGYGAGAGGGAAAGALTEEETAGMWANYY